MPARIAPWLRNTFISLFIVTAMIVPLAVYVMPQVVRWQLLNDLDSSDFDAREKALNYVIRHGSDPDVRHRAFEALVTVNDDATNFTQIAGALQRSGHWSVDTVPLKPWLRWLELLAADNDPESRIQATQLLTEVGRHHDPELAVATIDAYGLPRDEKPEVRYNALVACAELQSEDMVRRFTTDTDPLIAREAWLFLRLLTVAPRSVAVPDITPDTPPLVAEAMHWAKTGRLPTAAQVDMTPLDLIETLPVGEHDEPITADMTDTLAIAVTAVTKTPNAEAFYRVFDSPYPFIRDRAAVVAAQRFDAQDNALLIRKALGDFDDNAKQTGAILAGLSGLEGDLLTKKATNEDIWSVRQVQRLGLWMMDRDPQVTTAVAEGWMTRDDLPTTTILLAMLKQDRKPALNYILSPRTDEPVFDAASLGLAQEEPDGEVSLLRLLTHYRWWPVLAHFLPEDAPRISLWATPAQQQLELDILRNWWLVNRGL